MVPLVQSDDPKTALKISEALLEGGLDVLEVVLRTDAALDCLEAIAKEFGISRKTLDYDKKIKSLQDRKFIEEYYEQKIRESAEIQLLKRKIKILESKNRTESINKRKEKS